MKSVILTGVVACRWYHDGGQQPLLPLLPDSRIVRAIRHSECDIRYSAGCLFCADGSGARALQPSNDRRRHATTMSQDTQYMYIQYTMRAQGTPANNTHRNNRQLLEEI
jgi:hypothetical protein